MAAGPILEILSPGALTSVQDLGRYGHGRYGVAPSGALDTFALRIANLLVDNREDPQKGYMEWTTSGTNRRAARFMFIRWANKLNDVLMGAGIPIRD